MLTTYIVHCHTVMAVYIRVCIACRQICVSDKLMILYSLINFVHPILDRSSRCETLEQAEDQVQHAYE